MISICFSSYLIKSDVKRVKNKRKKPITHTNNSARAREATKRGRNQRKANIIRNHIYRTARSSNKPEIVMDVEKLREKFKLGEKNAGARTGGKGSVRRKKIKNATTTTTTTTTSSSSSSRRSAAEQKRAEEKIKATLKLSHPWKTIEDAEEVNVYIETENKTKVISFASEEARKVWPLAVRRRVEEDQEREQEQRKDAKRNKKKTPPAPLLRVIASKLEQKHKTKPEEPPIHANVFVVSGKPVVNEYDLDLLRRRRAQEEREQLEEAFY